MEDEVKSQKQNQEKLVSEFESERLVLKNMVIVTESVMEDQKQSLNNAVSEHLKANEILKEENRALKEAMATQDKVAEKKMQEHETLFENALKELTEVKIEKENIKKDFELEKQSMIHEIEVLKKDLSKKVSVIEILELQHKELTNLMQKCKHGKLNVERVRRLKLFAIVLVL